MSEKGAIKKSTAQAICDAVKAKEGTTEGVPFKDVADRILAIPKAKPEQEKTVDITENGTYDITADEGHTLSKVTANVNVSSGGGENKLAQAIDRTLTELTEKDLKGATQIGAYSLRDNKELISVTIPNTVTKIGVYAFCYCENLSHITLPDSVTSIGSWAFGDCYKLNTVVLPSRLTTISSTCFANAGLTSIKIPIGVTEIGDSAFQANQFTSVTIPNSVTSIGSSVFNGCSKLASVRIGNGISQMSSSSISGVFKKCSALTDIYIDAPEDSISGAPWGAPNSPTIHWNTPLPSEEV